MFLQKMLGLMHLLMINLLNELAKMPERFRDFPKVNKKYCIGCGACTISCPSPNTIKIVREKDDDFGNGLTFPLINPGLVLVVFFVLKFIILFQKP